MPAFLEKFTQQIKDFWRNLTKSQKTRIIVTSAAAVLAVIVLIVIVTRPNRKTLFQNEDKKQVGEMSQILTDAGIWNKVENDGTSVLIDEKNNDQSQVLLAQKGYPKGGFAFEDAISMIGLTTTDSEKKRIWKEQTVSDIENKIKMLDSLDNATVQLAIPEKSIFLTNSQDPVKPTSTVTIWPKEGKKLLPIQIDGIKQIVSGSVEDLTLENIQVIDNFGNPLDGSDVEDPMTTIMTQEELREKWVRQLENNVYKLYGLGQNEFFDNFSVVASPYLDFTTQEYTTEKIGTPSGFEPGEGALLEQHKRSESAENYTNGGVPSMDTNPGETTPIYPTGNNEGVGTYSMSDNQTAYGYDKTIETGVKNIGEYVPEKSSLSIVLGYGINVPEPTHLTAEYLDEVKSAARSATRIPMENISVTTMRLAAPTEPETSVTSRIQSLIADYGVLILLLFLIITLILSLFLRKKQEDVGVEDLQMQIAEGIIEPEISEVKELDIDEKSEIKQQIEKLVKQKPEAVASLLRNWISAEWE